MPKDSAALVLVRAPETFTAQGHPVAVFGETDAARFLSFSVSSLRRLRRLGKIPFIRLSPGRVGYPVASLRAWLDTNTTRRSSTPDAA